MKLGFKKRIRLLFILGIFAVLFVHNSPHYESYRKIYRLSFVIDDKDLESLIFNYWRRSGIMELLAFAALLFIPSFTPLLLLVALILSHLITGFLRCLTLCIYIHRYLEKNWNLL